MTTTSFQQYFTDALSLETPRVRLRPMEAADYDVFKTMTQDPGIWQFFTKNLLDPVQLQLWMDAAFQERATEKRFAFTIIDKHSGAIAGSTSLGNISLYDQRVEIGWTWLGTDFIGTGLNRHAKFSLLSYAFDIMRFNRVEVKTDNLNIRSRKALMKTGFTPEGVLRSHTWMHDGRWRDTAYFGMLAEEWPGVQQRFFSDLV